ncbi:MAG TPA: hypothetical protein VFB80_17105 [Pirellulaceae bacterium]|nr:hypothetical protein [Pirellulaceae bacterium]
MESQVFGEMSWERMIRAVENVRRRLIRVAQFLNAAGIPYAAAGGNAVAAWVSTVDEAAVRNTQDVDIVLRRSDLPAAIAALEAAGFVHRHAAGIDMFLDGPTAKARDAVHVVFAGEKVRPGYVEPAPQPDNPYVKDDVKFLRLEPLVRMKLTSNRRKDQVHIEDLHSVGLVDESWCQELPKELGARLKHILDTLDQ